jgi:hypothetical protein
VAEHIDLAIELAGYGVNGDGSQRGSRADNGRVILGPPTPPARPLGWLQMPDDPLGNDPGLSVTVRTWLRGDPPQFPRYWS